MRHLRALVGAVFVLLSLPVAAQVSSTRETAYDWACCEDAACATRTVHQRYDTAFVACLNKSIADGQTRWVQGGRYRVIATVAPPSQPPPVEPPADPPVATATLHWTAPTTNIDGTPLTDLVGYRVRYWMDAASPLLVTLTDPLAETGTVGLPAHGVWNFALAAINGAGLESDYTAPVTANY